jgi:hypothetical protein
MITTIKYRRWTIDYDRDKNLELYRSLDKSGSENCSCSTCRNFLRVKSSIYPGEIIDFYQTMGIEPLKEIYLCHSARKEPGLHYYSGSHISYGKLVSGNPDFINIIRKLFNVSQKLVYEQVTESFGILLEDSSSLLPLPEKLSKDRYNLFVIEFVAIIPWVLENEPEPNYGLNSTSTAAK